MKPSERIKQLRPRVVPTNPILEITYRVDAIEQFLDELFEYQSQEARVKVSSFSVFKPLDLDPIFSDRETQTTTLTPDEAQAEIIRVCDEIKEMLIAKNRSYGNSAFDPDGVFSQLPAIERLSVRIDDKLQRIRRGTDFAGDDNILDLIGYLVLLRISRLRLKQDLAAATKP